MANPQSGAMFLKLADMESVESHNTSSFVANCG